MYRVAGTRHHCIVTAAGVTDNGMVQSSAIRFKAADRGDDRNVLIHEIIFATFGLDDRATEP